MLVAGRVHIPPIHHLKNGMRCFWMKLAKLFSEYLQDLNLFAVKSNTLNRLFHPYRIYGFLRDGCNVNIKNITRKEGDWFGMKTHV